MNDVDSAQLDRFLRHAEDYALGFILGDGLGPGVFHFQQSARTIVPHFGQNYTDDVLACVPGGGAKQYIDRGPLTADQRAVLDLNAIARAAAFEQQMVASRRNQGCAREF
jgi:hypothetical protein